MKKTQWAYVGRLWQGFLHSVGRLLLLVRQLLGQLSASLLDASLLSLIYHSVKDKKAPPLEW